MKKLLEKLKRDYPQIKFKSGNSFFWSPKDRTVTYDSSVTESELSGWSLLHEVSHGILNHKAYKSDFELMLLEVDAWEHARKLGLSYGVKIDIEHIEDCLDTYRDWLHSRSTCPRCGINTLQKDSRTYACFNCSASWKVSDSRFCRPYRRMVTQSI